MYERIYKNAHLYKPNQEDVQKISNEICISNFIGIMNNEEVWGQLPASTREKVYYE